MGDKARIIDIAISQASYREGENNDNKFGLWYGMNNQPWCAIFISWCAAQAGIGPDIIPQTAWVPDYLSFRQAGYKKRGAHTPAAGDIILFDFNLNGSPEHAGIVIANQGDMVITIEGNTSAGSSGSQSNGDGVYQRQRNINSATTLGYFIPEYKEGTAVEIRDIKIKSLDTGQSITVKAGIKDNENYLRLREVEKIAPVTIAWDERERLPTVKLSGNNCPELKQAIAEMETMVEQLKTLIKS